MSPTIPNNINGDKRPGATRPGPGERRSELVCRVKYCNTLPDIPFDPKFITYPFDATRFIQYNPTSLERNYKYEVLTEHDLGVTIDLINKEQYSADPYAELDRADENLLEEDILTPHDSRRSRHHSRSVSWLRKTEYISTEQTRFQPQVMDKVEAKVGYSIKKSLKEETIYMDRESQIKAIEKTFEDAKKPIERHYSKHGVTPVETLNIFPDFKMWKYPCAQVMFDSDPAPVGRPFPAQLEEMSQAMIRGVMDESGEQFVAYFLPTEPTLEKRRRDFIDGVDYVDDEEYDYKIAREYNWNVKTKASKGYEENYFLVVRTDGVYFNELETRVRLTKRRQKAGQQPNNTRLVVRHRPMDAQEFGIHRTRERQLEPPVEEEEEEEEEEKEEEKKEEASGSDSDKENRVTKKRRMELESGGSSSEGEKSDGERSDKSRGRKSDSEAEKSGASKSDSEGEKSDGGKSRGRKSDSEGEKSDGGKSDKSRGRKSDSEGEKSDGGKSRGRKSDSEGEKSDGGKSDKSRGRKSDSEAERSGASKSDSEGEKSDKSKGGKSGNESDDSVGGRSDRSAGGKSDRSERSEGAKSDRSDRSDGERSDRSEGGKSERSEGAKSGGSERSRAGSGGRSEGERSEKEKSDDERSASGKSDQSDGERSAGSVRSNRSASGKSRSASSSSESASDSD